MSSDEDNDVPTLSAETLKALNEFYNERDKITFEEDWQLSQFWYDANTIETLVNGIRNTVAANDTENSNIALISCPSLYKRLKYIVPDNCEIKLFEFDKRFAAFGSDFHFYDYRSPLDIPRDLGSSFDLVIADPPFLSDECITKTSVTVKFLSKEKIVFCTGAIMADLILRLLNLRKCNFEPKHQNNLANEFWCYSNFDFDSMLTS